MLSNKFGLFLLPLAAVPALFAQSGSLTLGSSTVMPGGSTTLNLVLHTSGGAAPTSLGWTAKYPVSDVTSLTANAGASGLAAGKTLSCTASQGTYTCLLWGLDVNPISDGIVAVLSVTTSPSMAAATSIQVTDSLGASGSDSSISISGIPGTITAQAPAAQAITSLNCAPAALSSGGSAACAVILSAPAPAAGATINLASSNPLLTVLPSVAVAGNAPGANFTVTAGTVSSSQAATITAVLGSSTQSVSLSLTPSGALPLLQIHGDVSEVSGLTNGSIVTPAIAPPGFTGTVASHGAGTVNFAPAQAGNGVYFLSCCDNANNAYYKFTGPVVGNIFNVNQGQISFYLKSRYSFAQRKATAFSPRLTFDVQDTASHNVFYFLTQVNSGFLTFSYSVGGAAQFYYVPTGSEDTVFGNGATVKVAISWDGSTSKLFLNDTLVQSSPYSKPAPAWTANSLFDLGGLEYPPYGAVNTSDDIIDEFTVTGPAVTDTTPPNISITAPLTGATVSGLVTVYTNVSDNVGVTGLQYKADGVNLGSAVSGPAATSTMSWDTTKLANGAHTLAGVASDAAGNTATASVSVTVNNPVSSPPNPTLPTLLIHGAVTEVSGIMNGSVVTPGIAPPGFTGAVVANGTGSVNFAPPQAGSSGVYFLNCCDNANNAYYKFTGAGVGNIFNANHGSISFYLKSRYSFAQRKATASAPRLAFDVQDSGSHNVFYFLTQVNSGLLTFSYSVGGAAQFYYVPTGSEDTVFGSGVAAKVTIAWDGAVSKLYLNDALVQSSPYSAPAPVWTANSLFDLGGLEYPPYGAVNTLDDIIGEFTVFQQ